jgi:hypothetical protein
MCRNIKKLRRKEEEPEVAELRDAALQYVRKISGYRVPSRKNEAAFEQAIEEITQAGRKLFKNLKS